MAVGSHSSQHHKSCGWQSLTWQTTSAAKAAEFLYLSGENGSGSSILFSMVTTGISPNPGPATSKWYIYTTCISFITGCVRKPGTSSKKKFTTPWYRAWFAHSWLFQWEILNYKSISLTNILLASAPTKPLCCDFGSVCLKVGSWLAVSM